MIEWVRCTVTGTRPSWEGVCRGTGRTADGEQVPLLSYLELTGRLEIGDEVLANATALRRELGTGGEALVVANLDRTPGGGSGDATHDGHMVKARYTPLQTMVLSVDDPASPHREAIAHRDSIDGLPVVVADLHSSLPAIVAGIRAQLPEAKIVWIATDGAALPVAFSRSAALLRSEGLLDAVIASGQTFGGDLEAVTVHSALLAARWVLGADVAVVVQGPGNLGTGTGYGWSGITGADHLNAAAVLGGRPIGALRVSALDQRNRHRGLSHHSRTAYGRFVLVPVELAVPVPAGPGTVDESVTRQVAELVESNPRLRAVEVPAAGLEQALGEMDSRVRLSTMGRSLSDDSSPFLWAAAAGALAVRRPTPVQEPGAGL